MPHLKWVFMISREFFDVILSPFYGEGLKIINFVFSSFRSSRWSTHQNVSRKYDSFSSKEHKSRFRKKKRNLNKKIMKKNSPDIWPKATCARVCASEPAYPAIHEDELNTTDNSVGSDNVFSPGGSSRGSYEVFPGSTATTFRTNMTSSALGSADLTSNGSVFSFGSTSENFRAGSVGKSEKEEIKIPEFKIDLNADVISPKKKPQEVKPKVENPVKTEPELVSPVITRKMKSHQLTPAEKVKTAKPRLGAESEPFAEDEIIFQISKFNYVALWKWDVDCDICAICRVVICDPCLTVSVIFLDIF